MSEERGTDGPEGMGFQLLKTAAGNGAARLGTLRLPNRVPMQTPAYVATTSRGAVPHLTTDSLMNYTSFESAYIALEDFVEKKVPPIFTTPSPTPSSRPLHAFTNFPLDRITILGPRRVPPITTPLGNGNKHVTVFTSTGFRSIPATDYAAHLATLRPDIAIPLADLPHTSATPPAKKLVRMVDRTGEWLDILLRTREDDGQPSAGGGGGARDVALFAPVLPVERPIQWQYLDRLSEDAASLSGLALYDLGLAPELAAYPALQDLPRLVLQPPSTPHHLLRQISLGADMTLVPFVNEASDSGVALSFTFPPPLPESTTTTTTTTNTTDPSSTPGLLPLGSDISAPENRTSLEPLAPGCDCYACTSHHRAYLHHLIAANEMLAWTLLQVHNHRVATRFFAGVRASLAASPAPAISFEDATAAFGRVYEPEMPAGTGLKPRARGYHFKSQGGDKKSNEPAWSRFDEKGEGAEGEAKAAAAPTTNGTG